MTGSSNDNVQSKVSFKRNTMTGSSNNNVQSKVSFKGNTMAGSRVLISIITKEDSENAISNDLETQNFQNFPARRHGCASWESGPLSLTSFLPPE